MALVSLSLSPPCAPAASSSSNHLLTPPSLAGGSGSIRRGGPRGNAGLALTLPAGRRGREWRAPVSSFSSFLPSFFTGSKKKEEEDAKKAATLKEELLAAIAPLDRGAEATPEDKDRVEQIAQQLEEVNPTKEPLKSELLNGKWELLYTTSTSILQPQVPPPPPSS